MNFPQPNHVVNTIQTNYNLLSFACVHLNLKNVLMLNDKKNINEKMPVRAFFLT